MTEPRIADTKPVVLELDVGEYWWCACGRSANQPWCDESHKQCGLEPVKVVIEEKRRYAMCVCKQSKKGPFCDGSHKNC